MKILKHGDLQPRKFTCTQCKCVFVADKSEYGIGRDRHPYSFIQYLIACPECHYDLIVPHYDAPLYNEVVDSDCICIDTDAVIDEIIMAHKSSL